MKREFQALFCEKPEVQSLRLTLPIYARLYHSGDLCQSFQFAPTLSGAYSHAAHIGVAGRKPHPHITRYGNHSAFKHVEDPRQRFRVNLCIHPDASSVAKINLDQFVPGGRQLPNLSVIFGPRPRIFLAPFYRRGNLHRRKRWHDPLRRPCLSALGEHHARCNAIAACNLRHLRPWRQPLLDDPRLVITRPVPPALQPAQNLDPHRLMTRSCPVSRQPCREHRVDRGRSTGGDSPVSKLPAAQPLIMRGNTVEDVTRVYVNAIRIISDPKPDKALMNPEIAHTVWEKNVAFAVTAFCSYEWTSMPNNMNLHRNIFFKDCKHVPSAPFSALDSQDPTMLWKWMDEQRRTGNDLLAISHNANLSDGRMYPTEVDISGRPIDRAYAEDRMRNEPLIEIKQTKGQSETHPALSPNDEFADYQIWALLLGDPPGGRIPHVVGSYARQALKDGLTLQDTKGFNPYKFGFGAASDSHSTPSPYRQDNYFGTLGTQDTTIEQRMSGIVAGGMDIRTVEPAGLTGVWAEENTRELIFNAMQRKETFAVSGPHLKVRFFGGWNYADTATVEQKREFWKFVPDWIKDREWVKAAYAQGVPMGGDLTPMPAGDKAPSFAVWAVKDPTSANLDRIQIVKGWTRDGQSFARDLLHGDGSLTTRAVHHSLAGQSATRSRQQRDSSHR